MGSPRAVFAVATRLAGRLLGRAVMRFRSRHGVLAAFLLSGCFSDGGGDGCAAPGNGLNGGNFSYECASPSGDIHCDPASVSAGLRTTLPRAIAKGALFGLDHVSGARVSPVSPLAATKDGLGIRATRAGNVGFIAEKDGELVDAVRLVVVEPTKIDIETELQKQAGPEKPDDVHVTAGEVLAARAVASGLVGGFTSPLAGAADVVWSSDAEGAVFETAGAATCRLRIAKPGRYVLRAKSGAGLEDVLTVLVDEATLDGGVGEGGTDAGDAGAGDGGGP